MITVTVNELINARKPLQEISSRELPAKTAFLIARIIREIDKEYTTFENARREIILKYALRNDQGELTTLDNGNVQISPENIETCNKQIQELLNTAISLNIEPILIEDLNTLMLTPAQGYNLMPFVK